VFSLRNLLEAIPGEAKFMRRLNGFLTIFWIAMIPISYYFGWLNSVTFVSALSLWALVSGHWSTWQAARIEVEQERTKKELEANPIEDRVVQKLIAETDVTPE
jgi:hypothetical protein